MPQWITDSDIKVVSAPWWTKDQDGDPIETATIKRFSYGDEQWLAEQSVKVGINADETRMATVAIGRMNLAILERGIAKWTDTEGKSVQVSPRSIKLLTKRNAEFLLREIAAFNRPEDAEAQDNFRDESGSIAEDE